MPDKTTGGGGVGLPALEAAFHRIFAWVQAGAGDSTAPYRWTRGGWEAVHMRMSPAGEFKFLKSCTVTAYFRPYQLGICAGRRIDLRGNTTPEQFLELASCFPAPADPTCASTSPATAFPPVPTTQADLLIAALRHANATSGTLNEIRAEVSRHLHALLRRSLGTESGVHLFVAANNLRIELPPELQGEGE